MVFMHLFGAFSVENLFFLEVYTQHPRSEESEYIFSVDHCMYSQKSKIYMDIKTNETNPSLQLCMWVINLWFFTLCE